MIFKYFGYYMLYNLGFVFGIYLVDFGYCLVCEMGFYGLNCDIMCLFLMYGLDC